MGTATWGCGMRSAEGPWAQIHCHDETLYYRYIEYHLHLSFIFLMRFPPRDFRYQWENGKNRVSQEDFRYHRISGKNSSQD